MNILAIGNQAQSDEINQKFGVNHKVISATTISDELLNDADVILDFNNAGASSEYLKKTSKPVFVNTVFTMLKSFLSNNGIGVSNSVFGFCGLPSFINREALEVSVMNQESESALKSICEKLGTDYAVVKDQVGFATPRVIGMIINEAYITAEEGTASREDIDLAMKLGTNYPFGPFEWAKRIGIAEVLKLMDALYTSTNDERYKACDSLRHAI